MNLRSLVGLFFGWACMAGLMASESPSAGAGVTVGPEVLLPASPESAHDPNAAYLESAKRYLVAWESGMAERADIYACRIDEGGKPLDAKPFVVCSAMECQERVKVAAGKDAWLAVWADLRNDKDYDVYAARISADGKVLEANGFVVAQGENNQCMPQVAWNGREWLVAWRHFTNGEYVAKGVRVSPDGKVLDQTALLLGEEKGNGVSVGELGLGWAGGNWLITWVTRNSSQMGPWFGPDRVRCWASTLSADGNVATVEVFATRDGGAGPRAPITHACNGQDAHLISWFNSGTGGRGGPAREVGFGALVLGVDGKIKQRVPLGEKNAKYEIKQPAAVWDGKGWLLLHWFGRRAKKDSNPHENKVLAHVISPDGTYVGETEVVPNGPNPPYKPSGCGDGKGTALVVYERHPADADPEDAGILVGARFCRRP